MPARSHDLVRHHDMHGTLLCPASPLLQSAYQLFTAERMPAIKAENPKVGGGSRAGLRTCMPSSLAAFGCHLPPACCRRLWRRRACPRSAS